MRKERGEESSLAKIVMVIGILVLFFTVLGIIIGVVVAGRGKGKNQPDVTSDYIQSKIEKVSELTAAEMTYRGIVHFSDGEIPLISRKHFNMLYDANVRVGFNVEDMQIDVTDEKVTVTIPASDVLGEVTILPDSLEFYDVQNALFNQKENEDVKVALQKAQQDARLYAGIEGLKETADQHAKELVEALLGSDVIGERQLEVKIDKNKDKNKDKNEE
ncbi:MAG: DUF4230 domain-containing protein [Lachnospiraceae bacterium]|nr:DUF4230 domain-containing protein [Lachnospiraceae bacterium]